MAKKEKLSLKNNNPNWVEIPFLEKKIFQLMATRKFQLVASFVLLSLLLLVITVLFLTVKPN